MSKFVIIAALATGLFGAEATAASPRPTGEAKLAHALRGRTAGKPLACLNLRYTRSTRIIEGTAIVFESANTIYVNRPLAGAESLSESDALLTSSLTGELCRGEGVRLFDNASKVETGLVFFGDFVPYRKAKPVRQLSIGGGKSGYR